MLLLLLLLSVVVTAGMLQCPGSRQVSGCVPISPCSDLRGQIYSNTTKYLELDRVWPTISLQVQSTA
jgi:hypothetical protein